MNSKESMLRERLTDILKRSGRPVNCIMNLQFKKVEVFKGTFEENGEPFQFESDRDIKNVVVELADNE